MQTFLFDNTVCPHAGPIGDDAPMQPPGLVITTVIKQPWLPPPLSPVYYRRQTIAGTCAKKRKEKGTKKMAKIPLLLFKTLEASRYFS